MSKKKILFLGESYRADAITWINGLKEFGDFEIVTWELKTPNKNFYQRLGRFVEFLLAPHKVKKTIKQHNPDMIIAERTTSYGFLAALSGLKPNAIAQQGITDLFPAKSSSLILKKAIQKYAFTKATLIHAWGEVMTHSMRKRGVNMNKVLVLPKGIDLRDFVTLKPKNDKKITAIVTRSLQPEYQHEVILNAFGILNKQNIDFEITFVGDGKMLLHLKNLAKELKIDKKVIFTERIAYSEVPKLLQKSLLYISMPSTEGVSASLFEAMATKCYPIVSQIPGNEAWITHKKNGHLIPVGNANELAKAVLEVFEDKNYREKSIAYNYSFVQQNANYNVNMSIIAKKYHELINEHQKNAKY